MKLKLAIRRKPGPVPKIRPERYCRCGRKIQAKGTHLRCQSCAAKERRRKPRQSHDEKLRKRRALSAKWRAKNREKLRQYFRDYAKAHPELAARASKYYQAHKEKWVARARSAATAAWRREHRKKHAARINAVRREWDRRNPERARAIELRHRKRRRDKKRIADRAYRQQKPDIYKASIAKAKAKKPDVYRQHAVQSGLKRRARKKAAPIERVSVRRVFARDHSMCHLCAKPVDQADRSLDHLIPILRGGAHAEWNLMTAHRRCNQSRGTRQILSEETKEAAQAYVARRNMEIAA